jgi:CysZ protein
MIDAALAAVNQIFSPPFRAVFWKSLGLTILLLVCLGIGLDRLFVVYVHIATGWLAIIAHLAASLGLIVAIAFLVTPVSFVVAGFFFDELADHVEDETVGPQRRGKALPIGLAIRVGIGFALVSLAVNVLALLLLLVPGVNAVAFFGANAYLLGRGYFELAALRYRPLSDVRLLRRRFSLRIAAAGCVVALLLAIPLLNLLTPLFASAFMVRVAQPILAAAPARQAMR